MVKVSIIVPVYNVEKYLAHNLNSIINQTLTDIEIICINDGSTDSSLDILNKFAQKDSRIKIINKENEGQSVARNIGIREASGEYIGFVDSDDWVDKDYFEKMYNAAIKNNADIACAGFRRARFGQGSIRRKYKKEIVTSDINKKLELDNIPADNYVWNKIFKRESWLKAGIFFPEGRIFEDFAIVIKLIHRLDKLVTVPNTYYHYRRTKSSTITRMDDKRRIDLELARNDFNQYVEENGITLKPCNVIKTRVYVSMFGVRLLKLYHYEQEIKCKLFGFIPFIDIKTNK